MTFFRINLIRDLVPSCKNRMRLFLGLAVYVVMAGACLALLAGFIFGRVRERLEDRRRMDVLERHFCALYPDVTSLGDYSGDLKTALGRCNGQIALIRQTMSQQIVLAPALLALIGPLSSGMRVLSFALDRDKKSMTFEISVPVKVYESQFRTDSILAAWNQNPDLSRHVKGIVLVGSRRDRVGDHVAFILSFNCTLREAGN